MDKGTEPLDGGGSDADDSALWEQLEADVADDADADTDEAADEAADGEPEQPTKTDKPEKALEKLPYEELEKRHKNLNGALAEERATRKQLAERATQMETLLRAITAERQRAQQPEAPKIPDINEDPVAFFQHKIAEQERTIEELRTGTKQTREQIETENAQRQFWGEVQRSEVAARSRISDYDDAVGWLEANRAKEIVRMLPDTPQAQRLASQQGFDTVEEMRVAMLNHDRQSVAAQALRVGRPPADLYYEIAQDRGWKGRPKPVETARAAVAATKAGQAASKTIAGGASGRAADDMSLDDLADLYLDDPGKADKIFKRMQSRGLLG